MANSYQNPQLPEGINHKPENPLREFFILLFGVGALFVAAVIALSLAASIIARYIPFAYEQSLVERFEFSQVEKSPKQQWLQDLADRLALEADLPPDMNITVHYVDKDIVNAMATLGGHIFIFQGLLDAMPSENALAMVVAHEIAHVKHRHPIVAAGRLATVGIATAALVGISGNTASGVLLDKLQLFTNMSFSRKHERESDETGLAAVVAHYGHAADADALFRIIAEDAEAEAGAIPAIFSTHPAPQSRIDYIVDQVNKYALPAGSTLPIPDFMLE